MTPRLKIFARYSALTVLLAAASLILQSQMPTGAISGGGGGSGSPDPCSQSITAIPSGLHCATVALSSADLLSIDTPFVLVSAQGANTVVFPVAMQWKFTFVTTAYQINPNCAGAGAMGVWWQNSSNAFSYISPPNILAIFTDTGSFPNFIQLSSTVANYASGLFAFTDGGGHPANPVAYTNQPIVLQLNDSNVGNGCLNFGNPVTFSVGAAGTGYMIGDRVETSDPGVNTFTVSSVGAGGAVTGITNSEPAFTKPGTYTTTAQTGVGTGLTITISTIKTGDGTMVIRMWYTVAAP